MRVRAILNPRAGLAGSRTRVALAAPPSGWRVETVETRAAGHARELAAAAVHDGCDLVLSAGGDGTANECASALIATRVPLAVLPVGSGNGLARTLGVPLRAERALPALASGEDVSMDVGLANGRPFLNIAGAGFDAEVGHAYHQRGRHGGRRGIAPYVLLAAARLPRYRGLPLTIEIEGAVSERRVLVTAALNGRQYGAGAVLAPGARLNDASLDLVVIERASLPALLLGAARMFVGGLERCGFYHRQPIRSLVLRSAGVSHRDGEPDPAQERLEWRVQPQALRIRVPAATLATPDGPFGNP